MYAVGITAAFVLAACANGEVSSVGFSVQCISYDEYLQSHGKRLVSEEGKSLIEGPIIFLCALKNNGPGYLQVPYPLLTGLGVTGPKGWRARRAPKGTPTGFEKLKILPKDPFEDRFMGDCPVPFGILGPGKVRKELVCLHELFEAIRPGQVDISFVVKFANGEELTARSSVSISEPSPRRFESRADAALKTLIDKETNPAFKRKLGRVFRGIKSSRVVPILFCAAPAWTSDECYKLAKEMGAWRALARALVEYGGPADEPFFMWMQRDGVDLDDAVIASLVTARSLWTRVFVYRYYGREWLKGNPQRIREYLWFQDQINSLVGHCKDAESRLRATVGSHALPDHTFAPYFLRK